MFRDFSNYDVREDGRIWSKVRKKFLKPSKRRDGYLQVSLSDNEGEKHIQLVHRVCWIAVNGREVPEGYELNHLDENKANNHISNLQLCTHKDNMNYGTRTERCSKRVGAYDKNGEIVMVFPSTAEAGRNGYDQRNVSKCCRGKLKTHKGFTWKYLDN